MILETERLTIRPLSADDFADFHELNSAPENFVFELSEPASPQESKRVLNEWLELNQQFDSLIGTTEFCIEHIQEGKLIGVLGGLYADIESRIIEFGVIINHKYIKNGYAYEAASAYIRHAFSSTDVHRIAARTDTRNIACIRLLEKLGMTKEGILRKNVRMPDGNYYDEAMYSILAEEFFAIT